AMLVRGGGRPASGLLERKRAVGTDPAAIREWLQGVEEIVGGGVDRVVLQRDAGLAAERGVDAQRERMRDRMAEDGKSLAHGLFLPGPVASLPPALVSGVDRWAGWAPRRVSRPRAASARRRARNSSARRRHRRGGSRPAPPAHRRVRRSSRWRRPP